MRGDYYPVKDVACILKSSLDITMLCVPKWKLTKSMGKIHSHHFYIQQWLVPKGNKCVNEETGRDAGILQCPITWNKNGCRLEVRWFWNGRLEDVFWMGIKMCYFPNDSVSIFHNKSDISAHRSLRGPWCSTQWKCHLHTSRRQIVRMLCFWGDHTKGINEVCVLSALWSAEAVHARRWTQVKKVSKLRHSLEQQKETA